MEYFNEFTIPSKVENIRQRSREEAAILTDINRKFATDIIDTDLRNF